MDVTGVVRDAGIVCMGDGMIEKVHVGVQSAKLVLLHSSILDVMGVNSGVIFCVELLQPDRTVLYSLLRKTAFVADHVSRVSSLFR